MNISGTFSSSWIDASYTDEPLSDTRRSHKETLTQREVVLSTKTMIFAWN